MKIRLPGRCVVCAADVVWTGKSWKDRRPVSARVRRKHVCRADRPACGALMPLARERCARRPGHTTEHRSRYALENARWMRTGA